MLLLSNRIDLGMAHFDPEYLADFNPFYVAQYVRIFGSSQPAAALNKQNHENQRFSILLTSQYKTA